MAEAYQEESIYRTIRWINFCHWHHLRWLQLIKRPSIWRLFSCDLTSFLCVFLWFFRLLRSNRTIRGVSSQVRLRLENWHLRLLVYLFDFNAFNMQKLEFLNSFILFASTSSVTRFSIFYRKKDHTPNKYFHITMSNKHSFFRNISFMLATL